MTKVMITGHTKGIGKAIYDRFYPNTVGFSRANGYDIAYKSVQEYIIKNSDGCDVFINNAYSAYAQIDLLYGMYDAWKNTDKLIINISSNSADGIKTFKHEYAIHKAALDKAAEQLSRLKDACRITNIRPGYVNTDMCAGVTDAKIEPEYIANLISDMVNDRKDLYVNSITVLPRNFK